jgi:hypothetical protein
MQFHSGLQLFHYLGDLLCPWDPPPAFIDETRRSSALTLFRDAGGLFGGTGHNYSHLRRLIPEAGLDIVVSEVHLTTPGYTSPAEVRAGLLEASTLLADGASLPAEVLAVLPLLFSKTLTVDLGSTVLRSAAGPDIVEYGLPRMEQRRRRGEDTHTTTDEDVPMTGAVESSEAAPPSSSETTKAPSPAEQAALLLQPADLPELEVAIVRYLVGSIDFRVPNRAPVAGGDALVAPLRSSLLRLPLPRVVDLLYDQLHALLQVAASSASRRAAPTGTLTLLEKVYGSSATRYLPHPRWHCVVY